MNHSSRSYFILLLTTFFAACSSEHPVKESKVLNGRTSKEMVENIPEGEIENPILLKPGSGWTLAKISGSVLEFKNGKGLNTRLSRLNYIGQINNGDQAPFFIYSGLKCDTCQERAGLYIHSPSDTTSGVVKYKYPGSDLKKDGSILYKSRAF